MTRGRHHLDAEALGVKQRRQRSEDLNLAAVAAAAVHAVDVGRAFDFFSSDAFMLAMDSSTVIGTGMPLASRGPSRFSISWPLSYGG